MPALPVSTDFTGAAITEAQFKTAITALREYLAGLLGTDGVQSSALATLLSLFNAGTWIKTGAYTILASDRGKVFNCQNNAFTLSLPAAASVGVGFVVAVRASGVESITIDPNGSELINGAATYTLASKNSTILFCTGTEWITICDSVIPPPLPLPVPVASGGTGATSASAAADNLSVVTRDHSYSNVGSLVLAYCSRSIAAGATLSGSNLVPAAASSLSGASQSGSALAGTFRCLGYINNSVNNGITLFQRIA